MREQAISEYQLRTARPDDFSAIRKLLIRVELPVEGVDESLASFVVALADNRVIGTAGVERHGDYGLLRSVAVDPDWRGGRVGAAVVDRAIAGAQSNGMESLYLLTTTAEKYFLAFGFEMVKRDGVPEEIRTTSEFRDICPSAATVMRRSLRGA